MEGDYEMFVSVYEFHLWLGIRFVRILYQLLIISPFLFISSSILIIYQFCNFLLAQSHPPWDKLLL